MIKYFMILCYFISCLGYAQTTNNAPAPVDPTPVQNTPNTKAKPPISLIHSYDPFFETKERAKFWKDKGYNFDSSNMTIFEMDYMAKAIDRAKYWSERGFQFNPKTMTDYEMDNMVHAYEKAHNISAQKP